jgi:hypothetical protein
MQHLGDVHGPPLAPVRRSNSENPVPKLVVFCFCKEGDSVYLLIRNERGMYFNIAIPDIQKLLVNSSSTRLVPLV